MSGKIECVHWNIKWARFNRVNSGFKLEEIETSRVLVVLSGFTLNGTQSDGVERKAGQSEHIKTER